VYEPSPHDGVPARPVVRETCAKTTAGVGEVPDSCPPDLVIAEPASREG
jgi:hypothetical protein